MAQTRVEDGGRCSDLRTKLWCGLGPDQTEVWLCLFLVKQAHMRTLGPVTESEGTKALYSRLNGSGRCVCVFTMNHQYQLLNISTCLRRFKPPVFPMQMRSLLRMSSTRRCLGRCCSRRVTLTLRPVPTLAGELVTHPSCCFQMNGCLSSL